MSDAKTNWVDFRQVKEAVTMRMVLEHYRITGLRKSGNELRGACPIHRGEGARTFHVNLEKGAFNCFSCHARGNVLDFVAAMDGCSVRDAALRLAEWFNVTSEVGESSAPRTAPHKTEAPAKSAPVKKTVAPVATSGAINPPLSFQLKVDPNHEYGLSRGLLPETITNFGAGLCLSKGMFGGRYVIPLHDEQGRLVGYAGRSLDDSEPKYLFPSRDKGFYKSHLVFNLHRVLKRIGADDPVILVEGFFDTMKIEQAGFPALGLLGSSLSTEQEELIASHFNKVVLMFDGDDAGRTAAADALARLSQRLFVRVVSLADGVQPDALSGDEIRSLCS